MEKFVPIEKQSKKNQRDHFAAQRGSWSGVKPCARIFQDERGFSKAKRSRSKAELQKKLDDCFD